MTEAEILDLHGQIRRDFERSYTERKQIQQGEIEQFSTVTEWSELKVPTGDIYDTSVPANKLKDLANKVFTLPGDFNAHPNVKKMYQARLDAVESGEGIDWGTAEALAWASLLDEGVNVRISGQDVERGTFSQRHAVLHDQQVDLKKYSPLTLAQSPSSTFQATNSHLAEYAVLGYEYGYALADPNALVMWEAQFGDFANGAQIVIDCFLASGEAKWGTESSLVMILPHGLDGQGPEHSSSRIERFLQLSGEDPTRITDQSIDNREHANIQVVVPTTPANYFHILRRQVRRDFRKPLIIAAPKKLLRHKLAVSSIEDFSDWKRVSRQINETDLRIHENGEKVNKVILCSGQIYYNLFEERARRWEEQDQSHTAIVRLEQITPFPFDRIQHLIERYPNAEFKWVQEEHLNSGCWTYVEPRLNLVMEQEGRPEVGVVSRPPSATAAPGYGRQLKAQHKEVIERALA